MPFIRNSSLQLTCHTVFYSHWLFLSSLCSLSNLFLIHNFTYVPLHHPLCHQFKFFAASHSLHLCVDLSSLGRRSQRDDDDHHFLYTVRPASPLMINGCYWWYFFLGQMPLPTVSLEMRPWWHCCLPSGSFWRQVSRGCEHSARVETHRQTGKGER